MAEFLAKFGVIYASVSASDAQCRTKVSRDCSKYLNHGRTMAIQTGTGHWTLTANETLPHKGREELRRYMRHV
ncbi:hypothetical protein TcasGA2_TC014991 [Tribolium castaneum]|uniref:Uncharacterized protein n=1 Tax=Tribolium castaneum TaxID=7070 RepID=D2A6G2_TRICA|nr:hypothetical protein TcasGA2_TC014991 [Tribolium castaneum]